MQCLCSDRQPATDANVSPRLAIHKQRMQGHRRDWDSEGYTTQGRLTSACCVVALCSPQPRHAAPGCYPSSVCLHLHHGFAYPAIQTVFLYSLFALMTGSSSHWQVGWLVNWLVNWLVGWLESRLGGFCVRLWCVWILCMVRGVCWFCVWFVVCGFCVWFVVCVDFVCGSWCV